MAVFEKRPKLFISNAADKFKGPELFPTKKVESFNAPIISSNFKSEQSIK